MQRNYQNNPTWLSPAKKERKKEIKREKKKKKERTGIGDVLLI
jgi:hypothetical protein